MSVLWLPYVILTDGTLHSSPTIGPARFLPDTDQTWTGEVHAPRRPEWLDMYRQFPASGQESMGPPLHGTVVTASDEPWLRENARQLVAVAYFLGDQACLDDMPRTGVPAERFYFHQFEVGPLAPPLVEFLTKHGRHVEDAHHLKMTPPLPVRGQHSPYRMDFGRPEHGVLVRLVSTSPDHRLVTACLHYFLAQVSDPMVSPIEQDFMNLCAALEAAFGITDRGPSGTTVATVRHASARHTATTTTGRKHTKCGKERRMMARCRATWHVSLSEKRPPKPHWVDMARQTVFSSSRPDVITWHA